MPKIIVIGAGVIGLSAARSLQLAGYDVRVLTRESPLSTTSVAAGAVWSGSGLEGKSRGWARVTLDHFLRLTEDPNSGVSLQRMREVYAYKAPDPWYRDLLPFFQRLSKHEMRGGLAGGYLMDVPVVAPPLYLERLHADFLAAGGRLETRSVNSFDELADEAALLVNCSGVGARELAQDEMVYPLRGQTMLLEAPGVRVGYMDNDAVDHIFPRQDGVLIGGVKTKGDWNRELNPAISADIMRRCSRIEKRLAKAKVLREFVGLRPGRAQARLEVEQFAAGCPIIHNYGHATIGYTLSWGCAQEVVALARALEAP